MSHLQSAAAHGLWAGWYASTVAGSSKGIHQHAGASEEVFDSRSLQNTADAPGILLSGTCFLRRRRPDTPPGSQDEMMSVGSREIGKCLIFDRSVATVAI